MIHCKFCNQIFVLEKYLAAHITRIHKEEETKLKESENEFTRF